MENDNFFVKNLKDGVLRPYLDVVKYDSTLNLEIRKRNKYETVNGVPKPGYDEYTSIYYRGKALYTIEESLRVVPFGKKEEIDYSSYGQFGIKAKELIDEANCLKPKSIMVL